MEMEKELLRQYGLNVSDIEQVTDRLFVVTDGSRRYALKRSNKSLDDHVHWKALHEAAAYGQMRGVLPLYMARNSAVTLYWNEETHYLMPWIDADPASIASMFSTIGHIHARTKQQIMLNRTAWLESFRTYQIKLDTFKQHLLYYVERFENSHYMSPFELSYCTQFADIEFALTILDQQVTKMLGLLEKQSCWSTSLIHGRMERDHFLQGSSPYFVNWENTERANGTVDLLHFFRKEMMDCDCFSNRKTYMDAFHVYLAENQLSALELIYLAIGLLDPIPYLKYTEAYFNRELHQPMIFSVRELNARFRALMFGLAWVHYQTEQMAADTSNPAQVEREEQAD